MHKHIQEVLQDRLNHHTQQGLLRTLMPQTGMVDFWSNDYLGLSKSKELWGDFREALARYPNPQIGATGSRLISGNSKFIEELENELAIFHQAEAGLLFSSGYAANHGIIPALAKKEDTIITDSLVHASTIDGVRLSKAKRLIFRHNDLNDLRDKLKLAEGNIFVAVESVYSMDGDYAPLIEMTELAKEFGAHLIVDEAHATGIHGPNGEGRVVELGLENDIFLRIHTFGKGMGTYGAIVVGSETLREYLINFARTFIFSTGLSLPNLLSIQSAYRYRQQNPQLVSQLHSNIQYFKSKLAHVGQWIESQSPIQCLLVPGNEMIKPLASHLQRSGIQIKAILSPTVACGGERLRFCIHSFNQIDEIDYLADCFSYALQSKTG